MIHITVYIIYYLPTFETVLMLIFPVIHINVCLENFSKTFHFTQSPHMLFQTCSMIKNFKDLVCGWFVVNKLLNKLVKIVINHIITTQHDFRYKTIYIFWIWTPDITRRGLPIFLYVWNLLLFKDKVLVLMLNFNQKFSVCSCVIV